MWNQAGSMMLLASIFYLVVGAGVEDVGNSAGEKVIDAGGKHVSADMDRLIANKECGMHALYVMLRLRNYDISHEEFEAAVPVGANGSSLADLQAAAGTLGVATGIYQCDLDELLKQCDRPVVVLIHNDGAGLIHEALAKSEVEVGHYVTVLGRDEQTGYIVGIDGSDGRVRNFHESRFLDMWSGYVLLPKPPSIGIQWIVAVNIAFWAIVIAWLVRLRFLQAAGAVAI